MRKAQPNSQTKAKLLDAAEELMVTKGFFATSVEEICQRAKLTKGSFFHYFRSKEDLGKELLKRFSWSCQYKMKETVLQEADPLKRVFGYLDFAVTTAQECSGSQGCLVGNIAQQMSDTHPQIRSICVQAFDEWARIFKQDLDCARTKYAVKSKLDTQSLAEHFIAVLEGSLLLAKTKQDARIVKKSMQHFRKYLESLFEP